MTPAHSLLRATALLLLPGLLAAQQPAPRPVSPVLAFPEQGLDDPAAYLGYQTRLFKDAAGNTLQVYLDNRQGRVVHLWADAENESLGFSARDGRDSAAALAWGSPTATVARTGRARSLEYAVVAPGSRVRLGQFLLGSMRVERDFQYWGLHRKPFGGTPFTLEEMQRLLAALGSLAPGERARHLALLGARDTATLRARLTPTIAARATATRWTARVTQPSLDRRDTMTVEILADPRLTTGVAGGDTVTLAARTGDSVRFTVRVSTTGGSLTPLTRDQIFRREFLLELTRATDAARTDEERTALHRLERQVRGVELLSSREKLMAGLPTYATYFGRDMLVSAMMMRGIWRPNMAEFAIGAALRKLAPDGQVSHEEALGGQAVREAASEYVALLDARRQATARGDRAAADSLGRRAYAVLRDRRTTRENYHMIDDELHLPILAASWLADSMVPASRRREFLDDSSDGRGPRVVRLVRELALVARMTAPYAADASVTNLISFAPRDSGRWASSSWRDSGAGYGNGRWAMDVNAIWAPKALVALGSLLDALRGLGYSTDALARRVPDLAGDAPLARWARDRQALAQAIRTWEGAERHFVVRLAPDEWKARVQARLAAMPAAERQWWTTMPGSPLAAGTPAMPFEFLALALDADGKPIGVANTDVATRLFLASGAIGALFQEPVDAASAARLRRDIQTVALPYPLGLLVDRVGPAVANDAFASPAIWEAFVKDPYHGPRVVWGREVNLFLLGAAGWATRPGVEQAMVQDAITKVRGAVEASGFHSELWSYEFPAGRPTAVRYGSGSDVQLWSTTDLAVWYALRGR